ncbi:MAG: DNA mismatch repair endonuclease MutL, partial [Oscillospiraceae bacterium]|nr:DNA mismatch repair endonuclease MutL [Oscillospiraceae bacterium]
MPKINVLSKHIAELIAAGEVVERPASVVKELLENSIDAMASAVTVEIKRGGITYIRVTDNGTGIEREDVPKAFLSHATSKISNADDLNAIGTLGFRGEALASIGAVSKTEIMTRANSEDIGTRCTVEGSSILEIEDAGCPKGTTVVVRDIFYNTPARLKFLKKDVSEGNAVSGIVDKIALSHPKVSIRFIRDDKEVLLTPGDGDLSSAVYAVYGKEFTQNLLPSQYELNGVNVSGFVSKPSSSRQNRSMQFFFLNNRLIKNQTIMAALEQGYKGSIMSGKFPACVLFIDVPFDCVDVNVHPAKTEVRFDNGKKIFDAVYYCVKSAITEKDVPVQVDLSKLASKSNFKDQLLQEQLKLPRTKPENSFNDSRKIEIYNNVLKQNEGERYKKSSDDDYS